MKLRFWGVRGSFATPGPHYLRYGGNTPAVEIVSDAGQRVLIDLGTGITELGKQLMAGQFGEGRGVLPVLLTHTHLDHIQGLPFFTPLFIRGNSIRILGPELTGAPLTQVLQNQLNGHYSPLYGLENLAAGVEIDTMRPGASLPVEGFEVRAAAMPHGGMMVLALRISADGKSIAFLSDVEYPLSGPTADALALARGADLLVHDAMFSDAEYASRAGWGHSPVSSAIAVAERAGVGRLALFHHSPDSTDAEIDTIVAGARRRTSIPLFAAAEGPAFPI
ncbi:MAG TPA: MBL fold metallo-hydrolase [Kofleriaceae bacterium]|nr:MBL fold metallo-hydrolase [Kofleriaceae bacterium]